MTLLSRHLEQDISQYSLDDPLPPLPGEAEASAVQGGKTRFAAIMGIARREKLTVRQLVKRLAGGSGHYRAIGTPEQIADAIELWFRDGAADGFNVIPQSLPGSLDDFVEAVVPLLQRRGLFRTEYAGGTLREHYGLARPASSYAPR